MADFGEMFYGTLPEDTQDFRQVLAGIGRTIRDRAVAAGQRIGQSGSEAIALQNQIFGDPNRPLRVTDENALRRYTDMIMGGPLGFAPAGITAYHGSPYLFRQFDPAKVGTGEGAQAYGVGSGYTAEARPVAEGYRLALAGREQDLINNAISRVVNIANKDTTKIKDSLIFEGFPKEKITPELEKSISKIVQGTDPKDGSISSSAIREYDVLKKLVPDTGYLYKGDIPDEILPKFLDWDKPLHEQSPEVKKALGSLIHFENRAGDKPWTFKDTIESLEAAPHLRSETNMNPTGAQIYNMLGSSMMTGNKAPGQLEVTNKLNEAGIRGIRYLDEKSRENFSVQLTYKGEPYGDVLRFMTKKQMDDYVKESKDKGFGAKIFPQTSNFVPFKPEDYKIQEINDIPLEEYIRKGLL